MKAAFAAGGLCASLLLSLPCLASDYSLENWPTKVSTQGGTEFALTGNFAWDVNNFHGDRGYGTPATTLEDADGWRRREFGATVKKKGVFDVMAYYDFAAETWLDVFVRLDSTAWFGKDYGKLRVGHIKPAVGLEYLTSSRAGGFMELSGLTQALTEGRRTGTEWAVDRPAYGWSAQYFFGHDLQGDNPGTTAAGRFYYTPLREKDRVLHLGASASVENPDGYTDGSDVWHAPSARFRARPEAGLTPVRLVDSGALNGVDDIRRSGLEALWIAGPWSLQAEYMDAGVRRDAALALPDYHAHGWVVSGSWLPTGESRPYAAGNVGNPKPQAAYGAVELLLRYGELDLDNAGILGGRQRDLTFGANWYLTSHFKVQANYVQVTDKKAGRASDTDVFEMRAQMMF